MGGACRDSEHFLKKDMRTRGLNLYGGNGDIRTKAKTDTEIVDRLHRTNEYHQFHNDA